MKPATRHRLTRTVFAITLAALTASASLDAGADDNKVLRVGYQKSGLLAVLKANGELEQKLKTLGYSVKWFEFPAGPQLLEALNANSIDFGYTGAPPPVFAQAGGVRFVYVAAEPGGHGNEALIVKPDSPLRSVADLKGKRVALQKGSSSNYLLPELLHKAGLEYADVHPVYLPPADARAAFENGTVDAWVIWGPYFASAQQTLKARTIADNTSVQSAPSFYEATRDFADHQSDIVGAVLAQLRATSQWVNAHPSQTAELLAAQTGLDHAIVDTWVRRVPYATSPVTDEIARAQQNVADAFYGTRLIPQKIVVKANVWTSPEAVASLSAAK